MTRTAASPQARSGCCKQDRQILVSELTFTIGVSEAEAEERLNAALP